jgi:hypothetical protein
MYLRNSTSDGVFKKNRQQIMIIGIQQGPQTKTIKGDKSFLNLFLIFPDFPKLTRHTFLTGNH